MITRPKGTKDVTPNEVYKWNYVENLAKKMLSLRGFKEIRTPVFEHTELFVRGVGEGSDIVNKEMYTFLDKGDRSLTLKPEGTASIARAMIENNLDSEAMPQKLFMLTPCFRYERPQAGRLREHHQFSIEAFGSSSPLMEVEVIGVIKAILDSLQFDNYKININSIGCKECRKTYLEVLKRYYSKHIDIMCEDCKVRYAKNPLRLLDCKEEKCQQYKSNAPKPIEYLCDRCKEHYKQLKEALDANNISYKENANLVRGIDYYSQTVFEFLTEEKGALNVICGGGRYDGLIEELGGKPLAAVGVGLGIEHLLLLLEKNGIEIPNLDKIDLYIANASINELTYANKLANALRNKGAKVEFDLVNRSLKAQMKYANKIECKYVCVLGETEVSKGKAVVKNMQTKEEREFNLETEEGIKELARYVRGE